MKENTENFLFAASHVILFFIGVALNPLRTSPTRALFYLGVVCAGCALVLDYWSAPLVFFAGLTLGAAIAEINAKA